MPFGGNRPDPGLDFDPPVCELSIFDASQWISCVQQRAKPPPRPRPLTSHLLVLLSILYDDDDDDDDDEPSIHPQEETTVITVLQAMRSSLSLSIIANDT